MNITKKQFRVLLVMSVLTAIVGGVVSYFWPLPVELQAYLDEQTEAASTAKMIVVLVIALLASVLAFVATIGLFVFWRPARVLTVATWVVSFLITPLLGPTVDSGWVTAFYELSAGMLGAVIALAYCSPIKELFERSRGEIATASGALST